MTLYVSVILTSFLFSPKCLQCPPQDEDTENQLQDEVDKVVENAENFLADEEELDDEFDDEEEEDEEERGINELNIAG